nr:hypothetical protein [Tanacetum cinerariifolium]
EHRRCCSLIPVKSNSYCQAFNVKSLFGELDCPKKSQVKLKERRDVPAGIWARAHGVVNARCRYCSGVYACTGEGWD